VSIKRFGFEERTKEISMFLKIHYFFGEKPSGKNLLTKVECSFSRKKFFKRRQKWVMIDQKRLQVRI